MRCSDAQHFNINRRWTAYNWNPTKDVIENCFTAKTLNTVICRNPLRSQHGMYHLRCSSFRCTGSRSHVPLASKSFWFIHRFHHKANKIRLYPVVATRSYNIRTYQTLTLQRRGQLEELFIQCKLLAQFRIIKCEMPDTFCRPVTSANLHNSAARRLRVQLNFYISSYFRFLASIFHQ
jgi:hypothetical protein